MAQLGIRIPDEIKKRMNEKTDINWSEFIRKKIIEKLDYPKIPSKIKKLVQEYNSDLYKLWILHMFSYSLSINEIYETAELIFGKEMYSEVDRVRTDLENIGINRMYDKVSDTDISVGEAIRAEIRNNEIIDIEEEIKKKIKQLPDVVKKGVYLLSLYVLDDLDKDHTYIMPEGFERTWRTYIGGNIDMDNIFKTGILYKNFYSSHAYRHWWHIIHNYGLNVLEEINKNPANFGIYISHPDEYSIKKLIEREDVKKFLKWMGGRKKIIAAYPEEEEIRRQLDEENIGLKIEEFKRIRDEMVKALMLRFDFWPDRRRAGKRSSTPSYWIYRLDDKSLDYITDMLLKNL